MSRKTNTSNKRKRVRGNLVKRAAVLKAAEKVFAQRGFHEATISEIATKAGVSEGLIYEYFTNKEALLFSIPGEKSSRFREENLGILKYVDGAANKLKILIYRHLELFELNPDYANITVMILRNNRNFLKTDEYKVVRSSAQLTIDVIKEGIENGEFRKGIDPYTIRSIIWGSIDSAVKRKFLYDKKFDLLAYSESFIDVLFNGILANQDKPNLNLRVIVEHPDESEISDIA
ncbi:MAG TPA: TetR/AcrR family transcriptional regulator [Bacteroidales bacterium]|nr:TetR/AcrR family transcriptional regulator [Bacteroidales bacterium]